jgi:hypothetical protein
VTVREICLSLPDVTERLSHGAPTYFVRKKVFVQHMPDGHHQNGFPHLWCAAAPGVQEELIAAFPERIFRPPYVGHRGWLGVRLDGDVDWEGVRELCAAAWEQVRGKDRAR